MLHHWVLIIINRTLNAVSVTIHVTMKQWIIVVALLFVAAFASGQKAVFYFPAQSSELSEEQVDSIETLVASGVSIDSVAGIANQLRNTRTLQANTALALDRASAVLALVDPTTAVGSMVVRSSRADDRRVEIYFSTLDSSVALAGGAVEEGNTHLAEQGSIEDAAYTSGEAADSAATATETPAAGDTAAITGESGIELPDSLVWLPSAAPSLELAEVEAVVAPTPCECGAEMDRFAAIQFYFEVVDSATSILKEFRSLPAGEEQAELRKQFRALRAKAQGVRNCIKKSRREALAEAKANGEAIRFIPIKRSFVERYGEEAPCAATGEAAIEKAVKKTAKKKKKKRRRRRFSLRRRRKPKAFRHSWWLAFQSRLACRHQ